MGEVNGFCKNGIASMAGGQRILARSSRLHYCGDPIHLDVHLALAILVCTSTQESYNVGPPVISWSINPIDHSYRYHKP